MQLRNLLTSLISRVPGYHLPANLFRGVKFVRRSLFLRKKLIRIDAQSPFEGKLGKYGFCQFEVSKKTIDILQKLAVMDNVAKSENYCKTRLSINEISAIKEIFDYVGPEVFDYLGPKARLDGLNWMVTQKKSASVSQNWHTDNVGNRIKLFVCVEGDGTQPTIVIPTQDRIPNFYQWVKMVALEAFRWFGFKNELGLGRQFAVHHKTGSAFMFDTQLLHRGSYKLGSGDRLIFHAEFSVAEKHKIIGGPIGTKSNNSFQFDSTYTGIESFNELIDSARLRKSGKICTYSR